MSSEAGSVISKWHGFVLSCLRMQWCQMPTICLLLLRSNIMSLFTRLQIDQKESI